MKLSNSNPNKIILDKIKNRINEKIVPDGIVNSKIWKEQTYKLLFILKDTNRQKDSIAELLNDPFNEKNESGIKDEEKRKEKNISNLRPTWLNIARWTYGINRFLNDIPINNWEEIYRGSDWYENKDDKKGWLGELKKIAAINLKKTPGEAAAKIPELWKASTDYGDLIWEQITQIRADIVIFCSVSEYLVNEDFFKENEPEWKQTTKGYNYFKINDTYYIQFWHPNAHFPHNMMFFALMDIVKKFK